MNLVSIKGSEKPELKMTHTIHSPDIPWQAGWYIPLQNCSYYLHLYLPSLFVAKVFEDLRMISVGLSALYGRICTVKGDESETTILGIHKAVAGVLPNPSICTGAETRRVQGRKPSKTIKYEISSLANKKRIQTPAKEVWPCKISIQIFLWAEMLKPYTYARAFPSSQVLGYRAQAHFWFIDFLSLGNQSSPQYLFHSFTWIHLHLISFCYHAQLLIVIRQTINCDMAVQLTRMCFFEMIESPKISVFFFGNGVVQVCWFAWMFLISNNISEIFWYKLGVYLCVCEKVKQGESKGGLVSFINPEISIKFAKSEASCVTVNQHKKYLLCGSNFLKYAALWQSPYESFWHIIIHLLKDHFVYKNEPYTHCKFLVLWDSHLQEHIKNLIHLFASTRLFLLQ